MLIHIENDRFINTGYRVQDSYNLDRKLRIKDGEKDVTNLFNFTLDDNMFVIAQAKDPESFNKKALKFDLRKIGFFLKGMEEPFVNFLSRIMIEYKKTYQEPPTISLFPNEIYMSVSDEPSWDFLQTIHLAEMTNNMPMPLIDFFIEYTLANNSLKVDTSKEFREVRRVSERLLIFFGSDLDVLRKNIRISQSPLNNMGITYKKDFNVLLFLMPEGSSYNVTIGGVL